MLRARLDLFILLNFLNFIAKKQNNLPTSWLHFILLISVKELALVLPETLLTEYSAKITEEENCSLSSVYFVIPMWKIIHESKWCLSFSSHRVRGTMLLSMWILHWLSRMHRYSQMPVICLHPAYLEFQGPWVTEHGSAWGWIHNSFRRGLLEAETAWSSSVLPALLSLAVPNRKDEKWAQAPLLFMCRNI